MSPKYSSNPKGNYSNLLSFITLGYYVLSRELYLWLQLSTHSYLPIPIHCMNWVWKPSNYNATQTHIYNIYIHIHIPNQNQQSNYCTLVHTQTESLKKYRTLTSYLSETHTVDSQKQRFTREKNIGGRNEESNHARSLWWTIRRRGWIGTYFN